MTKRIVICFDGTAENASGSQKSNIGLIESLLTNPDVATGDEEYFLYLPGVGTWGMYEGGRITRAIKVLLGLMFGYGLKLNIRKAYAYLSQQYQPGDEIYLFGFSRGAYTARALIGMIHKCGVLRKDEQNRQKQAFKIFRRNRNDKEAESFKQQFCTTAPIKYAGLFDTVSSCGWVWSPTTFAYTEGLPNTQHIRHAMSIDERRAFYRANRIRRKDMYDVQQVWFAGVHGDIGGHYKARNNNPLTRVALAWILSEAERNGMDIDVSRAQKILQKCNPLAKRHFSLKGLWWLAEFFPKLISVPPGKWSLFARDKHGWGKRIRLNLGRHRPIGPDECVHESVVLRLAQSPNYRPSNLVNSDGQLPESMTIAKMTPFELSLHKEDRSAGSSITVANSASTA